MPTGTSTATADDTSDDRARVPMSLTGVQHDQVAAFRPAILAIRAGATAISVALASPYFVDGDLGGMAWCAAIVLYNGFRIIQPLRYHDDTASLLRVLVEVMLHVLAVAATGYWKSPFVLLLITAVMIAGFARGFGFALRVSIASAMAVGFPFLLDDNADGDDVRLTVQWTVELILVALIAGYARRVTGEADRQHTLALDRLGRLADANLLLHSLHQVAQTLPASLDLEEVLDTTMGRVKDLFDFEAAAILLLDETDQTWLASRWDGVRPAATYLTEELPGPLLEALEIRQPVISNDLLVQGSGLSAEMESGLYAPLPARDSTVGLIVLEHGSHHHFKLRDQELMAGFAEPAALAIDNAQWFARLRTVGADEERTRIARDLHDRIGQSLAYLAFELDRIVKNDARGKSVTKQLEALRTDVRGVVGEVRDTLYDLRTDVTEEEDVATILRAFLDRVSDRSDLEVQLQARATGRLPLMQERELWRIAQEAITNVERHARASRVRVSWECDGRSARLLVTDDGVGFPEGRAGRLDSYGVIGMRERAASVGALLDIAGIEGKGTTVRCEVRGA